MKYTFFAHFGSFFYFWEKQNFRRHFVLGRLFLILTKYHCAKFQIKNSWVVSKQREFQTDAPTDKHEFIGLFSQKRVSSQTYYRKKISERYDSIV